MSRNDYLDDSEDMPDDVGIPDFPEADIPDFPEEDTPLLYLKISKFV